MNRCRVSKCLCALANVAPSVLSPTVWNAMGMERKNKGKGQHLPTSAQLRHEARRGPSISLGEMEKSPVDLHGSLLGKMEIVKIIYQNFGATWVNYLSLPYPPQIESGKCSVCAIPGAFPLKPLKLFEALFVTVAEALKPLKPFDASEAF